MQPRIPLTNSFAAELNYLVISYLPSFNLRKLLEHKTRNYDEQINIQANAQRRLTELPTDLLPNLIQTLQKIPDSKLEIDQKSENAYEELCKVNEKLMHQTIENFFKKNSNLNDRVFIQDCIMHYCSQFPEIAGILLNTKISLEGVDIPLNYLIDHGADVNKKKSSDELSTLDHALLLETPQYQIHNLVNQGAQFSSGLPSGYTALTFSYSTMLVAALCWDSEMMLFLARTRPDQIQPALDSIKTMNSNLGLFSTFVWTVGGKEFKFSETMITKGYVRLLMVRNQVEVKAENIVEPDDKKFMLSTLKKQLAETKKIDECFKIYESHFKANYINYQSHPWYDYTVTTLFKASAYPRTKKLFLEALRERIYEILTSTEFTIKMKPSQYYEECLKVLDHPIFSEEHDKQGVNVQFKNKIKERIVEIQSTLSIKKPTPNA